MRKERRQLRILSEQRIEANVELTDAARRRNSIKAAEKRSVKGGRGEEEEGDGEEEEEEEEGEI